MPQIHPFTGHIVNPARAVQVVSPAYDAVSPAMRRKFAEAHPGNYLNTMRLREDFPPDAQPSTDELLALNKAKLDELLSDGSFDCIGAPALFVYRLSTASHQQTGIVCEVSVDEYAEGRLRKHENTRADKEDLLAQYNEVVGVASSPICLAYPHDAAIASLLAELTASRPALDFVGSDGDDDAGTVRQKIWRVGDADANRLRELFARVEVTYLTDGHHRAASGLRYAKKMRAAAGAAGDGAAVAGGTAAAAADAPYNRLFVALFSASQLQLLPFHRAVKDLGGRSAASLLAELQRDFVVSANYDSPAMPRQHGEFGMVLGGEWYRLTLRAELHSALSAGADPAAALDVAILQERILAPLLGIDDCRNDARLDYVSGVSGAAGLETKHVAGWAVCFACHATSFAQLMAVADAGMMMPPKSTYFEPKARSGIFVVGRGFTPP